MADGVLHDVAVLKVCDALVGVVARAAAQIRPRNKRAIARIQGRLKSERRVLQRFLPFDGTSSINQE